MYTKTMKVLVTILCALALGLLMNNDSGSYAHPIYHVVMILLGWIAQIIILGTSEEFNNDKIYGEYHDNIK